MSHDDTFLLGKAERHLIEILIITHLENYTYPFNNLIAQQQQTIIEDQTLHVEVQDHYYAQRTAGKTKHETSTKLLRATHPIPRRTMQPSQSQLD